MNLVLSTSCLVNLFCAQKIASHTKMAETKDEPKVEWSQVIKSGEKRPFSVVHVSGVLVPYHRQQVGMSIQELETKLRESKANIYLVACPRNPKTLPVDEFKFKNFNGNDNCTYHINTCVTDQGVYLFRRLREAGSKTRAANAEKLGDAGWIHLTS